MYQCIPILASTKRKYEFAGYFVAWMFMAIEQPLVFIWSEKKIAQFLLVSKKIEKTTMFIKN